MSNRFRNNVDYISRSVVDILMNEAGVELKSYELPEDPHNIFNIKFTNKEFNIEFFLTPDFDNDPNMGIYISEEGNSRYEHYEYFKYPINEDDIVDHIVGEILTIVK